MSDQPTEHDHKEIQSKFPLPWSFDSLPHSIPRYSSATIYAADSTWIAQNKGQHSEPLARLIVDAVNSQPPNMKNIRLLSELSAAAKIDPKILSKFIEHADMDYDPYASHEDLESFAESCRAEMPAAESNELIPMIEAAETVAKYMASNFIDAFINDIPEEP